MTALKKSLEDIEVPKQNWLLVINPAGGKGKAVELTDKHVLPMLNEADFSYEKIVTTHQGHAQELICTMNYKNYTGVALVGGKLASFVSGQGRPSFSNNPDNNFRL